jgi:DNA-binding PadR family transcriptional regulator
MALAEEDRHGYAILQDVERRTQGLVRLSAGTLYRSIQRMLEQGLLVESQERPAPEEDDERRRYYRITPLGRAAARGEARRLSELLRLARASGFTPERPRRRCGSISSVRPPAPVAGVVPRRAWRGDAAASRAAWMNLRRRRAPAVFAAEIPGLRRPRRASTPTSCGRTFIHAAFSAVAWVRRDRDRDRRAGRRRRHRGVLDHGPRPHPVAAVP